MKHENIQPLIEAGTVKATRHPSAPLTIYNYTAVCQYESRWCDVSRACRGLILHDDGTIVARPFPKFHNREEHAEDDPVFAFPFTVSEKMDGSLGILYHDGAQYAVATRGSFISTQAAKATQMLAEQYPEFQPQPGLTYLFEIIFPGNRIVVNYGSRSELVLLAVIDNTTGRDVDDVCGWPGSVTRSFDASCSPSEVIASLGLVDDGNTEGVVLRFDYPAAGQQMRVKVKLDEYKRLHRLMTMTTTRTVWEALSTGAGFGELLDRVPDEFHAWLTETIADLNSQYTAIEAEAQTAFASISTAVGTTNRKAFAELATKTVLPQLMFLMLDGRDYSQAIWKQLRPEASMPFKEQSEAVA